MKRIKLPSGSRTMSGDLILDRRGGDMWDKLFDWIKYDASFRDGFDKVLVLKKMQEIEKEYGID